MKLITVLCLLLPLACSLDDFAEISIAREAGAISVNAQAATVWMEEDVCDPRTRAATGYFGYTDAAGPKIQVTTWPRENSAILMQPIPPVSGAVIDWVALDVLPGDCFWGYPLSGPTFVDWCSASLGLCTSLYILQQFGALPFADGIIPRVAIGYTD